MKKSKKEKKLLNLEKIIERANQLYAIRKGYEKAIMQSDQIYSIARALVEAINDL